MFSTHGGDCIDGEFSSSFSMFVGSVIGSVGLRQGVEIMECWARENSTYLGHPLLYGDSVLDSQPVAVGVAVGGDEGETETETGF